MYNVYWTSNAKEDLKKAFSFFKINSLYSFDNTKNSLFNYISLLELFPKMGRKVPEINDINIRELIYKKYRIIYKIKGKNIYISQIIHSSRKFLKVKDDEIF